MSILDVLLRRKPNEVQPQARQGDRALAYMSRMIEGQIAAYGSNAVRPQVIKSIEGDLRRAMKKGPDAVEGLIQTAVNTPDYMRMLRKLGLNESHIRVMAMEAKKKYAK